MPLKPDMTSAVASNPSTLVASGYQSRIIVIHVLRLDLNVEQMMTLIREVTN